MLDDLVCSPEFQQARRAMSYVDLSTSGSGDAMELYHCSREPASGTKPKTPRPGCQEKAQDDMARAMFAGMQNLPSGGNPTASRNSAFESGGNDHASDSAGDLAPAGPSVVIGSSEDESGSDINSENIVMNVSGAGVAMGPEAPPAQ